MIDQEAMQQIYRTCRADESATEEIQKHDQQILALVRALGGGRSAYRRERSAAIKAVVAEIYSPPRVTRAAKLLPSLRMLPGFALDLTTVDERGEAWDFSKAERRQAARGLIDQHKPFLVVGSPECTKYCTWQAVCEGRRDPAAVRRERAAADVHMRFVCEIYAQQYNAGRYFLHEHPDGATSWGLKCVQDVLRLPFVERVVGDQCQYGQQTDEGDPMRKRTGWMSNSAALLRRLDARCRGSRGTCTRQGGGRHAIVSGSRRSRQAAVYPFKLCRAILEGARDQLRQDERLKDGVFCILPRPDCHMTDQQLERRLERTMGIEFHRDFPDCAAEKSTQRVAAATCDHAEALAADVRQQEFYKDALTGQPLVPALVHAARREELEYFNSMKVWELRSCEEARRQQGKPPISVKWVDVNKGDDLTPRYRSRLVAREVRRAGEDPIFAPAPPLEAVRTIFSIAATDLPGEDAHDRDPESEMRTQVSLMDISRAYLSAHTDPDKPTYVALPREHEGSSRGMCGLCLRHMYGTRKAGDGWHCEYSGTLIEMGFDVGVASPCTFFHKAKSLRCAVYGDDLTTVGPKKYLDEFKANLEARYELKELARLGPGAGDDKEGCVLNRLVRWTARGLEYEADPRQCERLVKDLKLAGAKSVVTPGVKVSLQQLGEDEPLEASKHSPFRAVAARANYVSADRPDTQFAAKEVCRWMAKPSAVALAGLKRLGRYLEGKPRLVYAYPWQAAGQLEVYADTDWAGCPRTRKSTSGGGMMMGSHLIKSWSSTQPLITLSSGEAEFHGVVKAAGTGMGYQALLADLGVAVPLRVWTDSTASIGICGRQGLGRLRHIDTQSLWIQQRVRDGSFELRKVRGSENPADLLTKHLVGGDRIPELLKLFGCEFRSGRAESAPMLREAAGTSKGELLACQDQADEETVEAMVDAIPADLLVEWHGQAFPRADGDGETGVRDLPEAFPCRAGLLPHQHLDEQQRFPKAYGDFDFGDEDLEGVDVISEHGGRLGQAGPRCRGKQNGPRKQ